MQWLSNEIYIPNNLEQAIEVFEKHVNSFAARGVYPAISKSSARKLLAGFDLPKMGYEMNAGKIGRKTVYVVNVSGNFGLAVHCDF